MELKEFIKQTIIDIADGMREAHSEIVKNGKGIDDTFHMPIKFDVAISAENQSGSSGGGKVNVVSVFNFGGELTESVKNTIASRIQFELKIHVKTAGSKPWVVA